MTKWLMTGGKIRSAQHVALFPCLPISGAVVVIVERGSLIFLMATFNQPMDPLSVMRKTFDPYRRNRISDAGLSISSDLRVKSEFSTGLLETCYLTKLI